MSFVNAFSINGKITDNQKKPIKSANIQILGTDLGTSSDKDGSFVINGVESSEVYIEITHIGYEILNRRIYLNDKKKEELFVLNQKIENYNEIVVTGQRKKVYIKDSPVLTRVINQNDIENSNYSNVKEILEMSVPNIQNVVSNHAGISNNNVKIQGLDNRYMLFLIDGSRVSGEFAGNLDFNMLDLSNVERIEIVDGGMSCLYGSSAIGGVVNIITKNTKKPFSLSASYQNEKPVIISSSISTGFNKYNLSYDLNFLDQKSVGYDLSKPDSDFTGLLIKTQEEYSLKSINHKLKYDYDVLNIFDGHIDLKYKEYRNQIFQYENHRVMVLDEENLNYPSYIYQTLYNNTPIFKDSRFALDFIINKNKSTFKISYLNEYYRKYSYFFNFNEINCSQYQNDCNEMNGLNEEVLLNAINSNESLILQFNQKIKNHELIFGFENKNNQYNSYNIFRYDHNNDNTCGIDINGDGSPDVEKDCWSQSIFNEDGSRDYQKKAVFIGDQITFNNDDKLNFAFRNIDSNDLNSKFVYSLSYLDKKFISDYSLRYNLSRGFRTPSVKELFYNFQSHPPPVLGNPNLKSTINNYFSISFEKRKIDRNYSLEFYYNDVKKMIGIENNIDEFGNSVLQYTNFDNVTIMGFNLHYDRKYNKKNQVKLFFNYTYPESKSKTATELISKYSLRINFNHLLTENLLFISNIRYISKKDVYFDDNKIILDDYSLVEVIGKYNITNNLIIKFGVKNLFDYKDSRRFESDILTSYDPGRRYIINLMLKF